ncbi:MAG: hypothetical protein Q4G64_07075 [bacterium]|nr:hypothetical protein [bacterium]
MSHLDPHLASLHHLLVLDAQCSAADVAALARSRYPDAAWIADDAIVLERDATLTGPWEVQPEVRSVLDLPAWSTQAWVCLTPKVREGGLPLGLEGHDPILDAFPSAIPTGIEFDTLRFMQSVARRLAGAVHLAGTSVVLMPDPQSAVDLTVYGPGRLDLEEFVATTGREDARIDSRIRKSWALWMPALPGGELDEVGGIHVIHQRSEVPFAISGMEWAEGARMTSVRWHEPRPMTGRLQRADRHLRLQVIQEIEQYARAAAMLVGGIAVDDDGFVVAL